MRSPAALLLLLAATALATPGAAQAPAPGSGRPPQAARPPGRTEPPRPDPELAAAAQKLAGAWRLTSADGTRSCPVVLKPAASSATTFGVEINAAECSALSFAATVRGWAPDASGAIRLRTDDGRLVAEFTEATGGTYEALREGDGVYFLVSPAAVQMADVSPEEMLGEWMLMRTPGSVPLCRWTLTETPAPASAGRPAGLAVRGGACPGLGDFAPAAWRIEGGNVVVNGAAGSQLLRFARQEDGSWAKTPERGRPLLLVRP